MKDFEFLFDASANLLEKAEKNEQIANNLLKSLNNSRISFDKATNSIDEKISNILEKRSKEIVENITKQMTEVNKLTDEAAKKYKNAIKWSIWKLFFFAIVLFALFSSSVFVYYKFFLLPEINEMRETKMSLEQEIDDATKKLKEIRKKSKGINFSKCKDTETGHVEDCVEVIPNGQAYYNNEHTEEYRAIRIKY